MKIPKNSKILCIMAHREDNIIFGWPILQNPDYDRYLLYCTNEASDLVTECCKRENTTLVGSVGLANGFSYRNVVTSFRQIHKIIGDCIAEAILKIKPDFLFTHNPFGEYGHYDHRFLFQLVYSTFPQYPLLITDIAVESEPYPIIKGVPRCFQELYINKKIEDCIPDLDFYRRNAELFEKHNMWDASPYLNLPLYPKESAGLYLLL